MPEFMMSPGFWQLASVPVVAAILGWLANRLTIAMTFRPHTYRGLRPFGWQGVVPRRAERLAVLFHDQTVARLAPLAEVFAAMDPAVIAGHVSEVMDRRLRQYTDEVMFYGDPKVWGSMPGFVKDMVYTKVREEMPQLIRTLLADAAADLENLVDFRHLIVTRLAEDKPLLERLFVEPGRDALRTIELAGLVTGFVLGLAELGLWSLYPTRWLLPASGVAIVLAARWAGLALVFRPVRPVRIGPFTFHGRFPARQAEVAGTWSRLVASEILSLQQIVYSMLYGPHAVRVRTLIKAHIQPIVDEVVAAYNPMSKLAVGGAGLDAIRGCVGEKAVSVSTDAFDNWSFNRERSAVVEAVLRERMEQVPPEEFEELLRPCFAHAAGPIVAAVLVGAGAGAVQTLLFWFAHRVA